MLYKVFSFINKSKLFFKIFTNYKNFIKISFTIPSSIALDISTLPIALDGFNNI